MTIPGTVRDLALRLGASLERGAGRVTLGQSGKMKLRLDRDQWFAFTARQTMEVATC